MEIKVSQNDDIKTITITGELKPLDTRALKDELQDLSGLKELHIDMAQVKYADSSFLNLMVTANKSFQDLKIKLINPNKSVSSLLSISGLEQIVDVIRT